MSNFENSNQQKNYKSEAIQTFINEVQKNDCFYLLDVISLEDIETLLNQNLKAFYKEPLNIAYNWCAFYNSDTKTACVNQNLKGYDFLLTLAHELSHALFRERGFIENRGFSEGIAQYTAEQVTGLYNDHYNIEKTTYGILSNLIGPQHFIKDYIYGSNDVEKEFKNQYGEHMLELYKSAFYLLDVITNTEMNYSAFEKNPINIEVHEKHFLDIIIGKMDYPDFKKNPADIEAEKKLFLDTINSAKSCLDNVLDEMISLYLEKSDDSFKTSSLLDEIQNYPRKSNFKKFDLEKEKQKCHNLQDDFFKDFFTQTDEVTITQINKETNNIRESILKDSKSLVADQFDNNLNKKGEEK